MRDPTLESRPRPRRLDTVQGGSGTIISRRRLSDFRGTDARPYFPARAVYRGATRTSQPGPDLDERI